jgi:hypothetical protein
MVPGIVRASVRAESWWKPPFKLALMELVVGNCLSVTDAEDSILFGLRKRSFALLTPGARHDRLVANRCLLC